MEASACTNASWTRSAMSPCRSSPEDAPQDALDVRRVPIEERRPGPRLAGAQPRHQGGVVADDGQRPHGGRDAAPRRGLRCWA